MSKLYFRFGAMNSGKSTSLLQAAFNYEERSQHVLLAKPAIDSKGDRSIVSRLGVTRQVDFLVEPNQNLREIFAQHVSAFKKETGESIACLLIDEAQFLTREQVDQCLEIAKDSKLAGFLPDGHRGSGTLGRCLPNCPRGDCSPNPFRARPFTNRS
jgi:thymidine kinase